MNRNEERSLTGAAPARVPVHSRHVAAPGGRRSGGPGTALAVAAVRVPGRPLSSFKLRSKEIIISLSGPECRGQA